MLRQEWQIALVRDIQNCFPEEVNAALRSERRKWMFQVEMQSVAYVLAARKFFMTELWGTRVTDLWGDRGREQASFGFGKVVVSHRKVLSWCGGY